ncbi:uncharacterized protein [Nicotiana sylvestris]|uniref:Uncharacterized protein LOC104238219 isoform X1 n=1 Tax=Nicotiana sylvestris TaxID=4096 RepID=A0A1U7XMH9_NICSY|nr:PREDICTED: uncharacterized protein LOC104238219 isoform X1 [Nicotiana sylvestris]
MPEDILSFSKKNTQIPIQKETTTISIQEENDDFWGYSNLYHSEMCCNSGTNEDGRMNFNLTNQSTITEVAAMCTDSVAKFGIVELGVVVCAEVSGTAICDEVSQAAAIGVSKRGRSVKKKIMTDYVSAVIKKKSRVRK